MSSAFLLTTLVVVATPGAGVVYTLAAALSQGRRAGLVAAFGSTLSVLPHLAASVAGLSALLHTSAAAYETVRYAGVGYLLYLAWAMLRDKGALTVAETASERTPTLRAIGSAILANLLNPKVTLFFAAFLPQFAPSGQAGSLGSMLRLGAVFMGMTLVVFAGYALCAAAVRDRLLARPKAMTGLRRVFAASFVALSARLAAA
ncbi:LysE family translocator [Streptomyces sp. ODS05-4]|uniref:LysE family translocator n=1 Tax=Streptomyces sp. ODS05-4 TaxID=2944939 RepID=UPI00210EB0EB|nr:LysE family translocator [Streptomyces sp. ODS05-4]